MKKLTFLVFSLQISILSFGQNQQERLDSLFIAHQNKNSFNGNVLIADKGKIILEKSYGLENIKENIKLTDKSIFNLASVTKQFTAASILFLEIDNKLSLSDDITKYIPELSFYKGIKIEHLIHHTSGLPDYMQLLEEKADKSKIVTNNYVIELFTKEKPDLLFTPNDKFEYSNTAYLFLATIIERISNTTFSNYLKQKIFTPLDMNNTNVLFAYKDNLEIANLAVGYAQESVGDEPTRDIPYVKYFDGAYGQGRIYSTARDLLKWNESLKKNTLFTKEQTDKIFANYKLNNKENTNYGFGIFLDQSQKYGKIINHSGGWGGYTTFLEQHLTNDKTIILLQNNSLIVTKIPINEVRKILYNEPLKSYKPINLKTEELDKYLGIYSTPDVPLKISITKKENILYSQATDQIAIPMDSYENNIFKFEPADIILTFNPEDESFELSQGGIKLIFRKE